MLDEELDCPSIYLHARMRTRILQHQQQIKIITIGTITMGSKPKVQKQDSAEEIERKAKELAQKEANENTASRRKYRQSSVLGSLFNQGSALGNMMQRNQNTGSNNSSNTKTGT